MVIFEKMMPQERETCAALAARAFNDYEYFTDYVPEDKKRSRFLNTMLQIEVKLNDEPATFFTAKDDGKSWQLPCSARRIIKGPPTWCT